MRRSIPIVFIPYTVFHRIPEVTDDGTPALTFFSVGQLSKCNGEPPAQSILFFWQYQGCLCLTRLPTYSTESHQSSRMNRLVSIDNKTLTSGKHTVKTRRVALRKYNMVIWEFHSVFAGLMNTTLQQDPATYASLSVWPALGSLHQYTSERHPDGVEPTIRLYKRGDLIYSAGQPSKRIFEVIAGVVRTSNLTVEGEEVTTDIKKQTDLFGNLGVLPDPCSEIAKALTDTYIKTYDHCFFSQLKATDPLVNTWFNDYIIHRWSLLEKRLLLVSTCRIMTRVDFLYELFDIRVSDAHGRPHKLMELLTQKDMADLMGTSRQTVSAVLKKKGYGRR